MKSEVLPEILLEQISAYVEEKIGLHFPRTRWTDLQRGFSGAVHELGFSDLSTGANALLSKPLSQTELDVLAAHLTIGETYFFRDKKSFAALREKVLPELIFARRKGSRCIRIWSAACCTGEEAYSIAILLHQLIPQLTDWNVTILATDLNPHFLRKAIAGVYREWAFRDTSGWIKQRYFERAADDSYVLLPEVRRLVTFTQLNLVEDLFPSVVVGTNAMDLILCRNVLMYFSPEQVRKVVANLHRSLVKDGWLLVSPSETSQILFRQFETANFPGVIFYRKGAARSETQTWTNKPIEPVSSSLDSDHHLPAFPIPNSGHVNGTESVAAPNRIVQNECEVGNYETALSLYEQGQYASAIEILIGLTSRGPDVDSKVFSLLTRALADQGSLQDALVWCDRWVQKDKLNPLAHYLRAVVLQELGDIENARRSFQASIYINPRFVLAHFSLGNLARSQARSEEGQKHLGAALSLLRNHDPNDVLPESDGLTAGRLIEIITSITNGEETLRRAQR